VVITYVMVYARRVKRNPELSAVRDIDLQREAVDHHPDEHDPPRRAGHFSFESVHVVTPWRLIVLRRRRE
jgi:uncharacterized ion transporter superfamily protein YfcC